MRSKYMYLGSPINTYTNIQNVCVCVCVYIYKHTHTHTHTHIHIYIPAPGFRLTCRIQLAAS